MIAFQNEHFSLKNCASYLLSAISYQLADSSYHSYLFEFQKKYIWGKKIVFSFFNSLTNEKSVFYSCYLYVTNNIKINRNEKEKKAKKMPLMSFFQMKTDSCAICYLLSAICYLLADAKNRVKCE